MSRSRRKKAIIKETGRVKQFYQRLTHRRRRNKDRRLLNCLLDFDALILDSLNRESVNPYDVSDYKFFITPENIEIFIKTLRK